MSFQTSVVNPGLGYEGQLQYAHMPRHVYSRRASAMATRAIVPGQPVLRGADPALQVVAVTNGATLNAATFAGFAVLDDTRPPAEPSANGQEVSVLADGYCVVRVTAAVAAGQPVWVGTATAQLGDIADATGTGLTQVPGSRFVTSASASGLAVISLART